MTTTYEPDIIPAADKDRAVATITRAFADDPVVRWVYPGAEQYSTHFPRFIPPFAGAAFAAGSADTIADVAGAALWLPPGAASDDDAIAAILDESIEDDAKEELFGFLTLMGEFHPHEPHWYLPLIGVDPDRRGLGYGGALLRHALKRADGDGLPAYLEATSPLNKALYERHGFEEIGVIQFGNSPPMWPMLRRPR